MSRTRISALAAIGVLLLIQVVPLDRSNPPVEEEVPAPAEVRVILERSCYDCHSHQVRWPWYAYVAPISFLVTYDVAEAREHMNLSTWNRYNAEDREEYYEEIWEEVEEGHMPLPIYLWLHPEAELDDREREQIRAWSRSRSGHDD